MVFDFFCSLVCNFGKVEVVVGVCYYVVLFIVGIDWMVDNVYFIVKVV